MSIKKSYISKLLTLLTLFGAGLLSGCSDDFNWRGENVSEDEYLIAFTSSSPIIESITSTRATDADRNKVTQVALVMFNGGTQVGKAQYFTLNSTPAITPESDGIGGSVKVKRSEVTNGDWYLIANANTTVSTWLTNHEGTSFSASEFLAGIKGTEAQLENNGNEAFIMVGSLPDISVSDAQTTAPVFQLDRIFSRITVENTTTDGKFLLTGVILDKCAQTGNLALGTSNALTANNLTSTGPWQRTPATGSTSGITHTKSTEQLVLATYPYQAPLDAEGNASKATADNIFLVIEGYFDQATQEDIDNGIIHKFNASKPCYYAVQMPKLEANHRYRVVIEKVPMEGQENTTKAIQNPGGLSIDFVDDTERIRDIISDGKNVLAVCDTVRLEAGTTEAVTKTLPIKARHEGNSHPTVTLTKVSGDDGWLSLPAKSTYNFETISTNAETSNGLFSSKVEIPATAQVNKGSEREVVYNVKLDGTDLERTVVFLQSANENLKYSDAMSITLKIKRNGVEELSTDYLKFVNPSIASTSSTGIEALGVQPSNNGGRQRNLGLHQPMPNGGNVQYIYEITLKTGATLSSTGVTPTSTGNKYTYTFTDGTTDYGYKVTPDAISIVYDGATYTLDLYHTGFFYQHEISGTKNWHYYEVFTQNSTLHWLDRNLGATSAGMGVRNGASSVLQSSEWPIVGTKAMGETYTKSEADANKIPGWNIPSYAQMRSLTTLAGFTVERMSTFPAQTPYYAPSYMYTGTEGSKTVSIRSYFPQNMMYANSAYTGDKASGYYMTTTGAGETGWYQCMQFTGMNVTSINRDLRSTKMSVRLCAGSYNPSVEDVRYTASVKGYTHVYLYYLNTDGSRTNLTTWPGEQIAMSNDIDRYHLFEITPTMNYNKERLYVIFNTVQNSSITNSNVSSTNVSARKGIKFEDGKFYDKEAETTAAGAKEGDWLNEPILPETPEYFTLYIKNSANWDPLNIYYWDGEGAMTNWNQRTNVLTNSEKLTIGSDTYYVYTGVPATVGSFKFESNGSETNNYQSLQTYASQGIYTLKVEVKGNAQNIIVSTDIPEVPVTYNLMLNGAKTAMTQSGSVWSVTANVSTTGTFAMEKVQGATQLAAVRPADGASVNASSYLGVWMDAEEVTGKSNTWNGLTFGTYKFEYNPTTKKVRVSRLIIEYKYKLHGSFTSDTWGSDGYMTEENGLFTKTIEVTNSNKASFGIERYKSDGSRDKIDGNDVWIFKSGSNGKVVLDTPMSCVIEHQATGTNWTELGTGKYTFTFDPAAMTLTVVQIQSGDTDDFYYRVCTANNNAIFSDNTNYRDMTKSGNNWVYDCPSNLQLWNGKNFVLYKMKKSDNSIIATVVSSRDNTTISVGEAHPTKVNTGNNTDKSFWYNPGSNKRLRFTFNPTAKTLTLTQL